MPKFLFSLIIFLSFFQLFIFQYDYNSYPYPDDDYDGIDVNNDYSYYDNFNETLKDYLVDNGYFDSEKNNI